MSALLLMAWCLVASHSLMTSRHLPVFLLQLLYVMFMFLTGYSTGEFQALQLIVLTAFDFVPWI